MKLLFALGNPDAKYNTTRHNIGFAILDDIAKNNNLTFQHNSKFSANIAECNKNGEKILLVKPTTYYNEVGISAQALVNFYKLSLNDILVIHDDLMLKFGKIRVRQGGEDAGNNGLKSLHLHIGEKFWHIRIGTGSELRSKLGDLNFVLGKFTQDEQAIIQNWTISSVNQLIDAFLEGKAEPYSISMTIA